MDLLKCYNKLYMYNLIVLFFASPRDTINITFIKTLGWNQIESKTVCRSFLQRIRKLYSGSLLKAKHLTGKICI